MTTKMLKILMDFQQEKGFTNKEFAKKITIHEKSWLRNKSTGIVSSATLFNAANAFPELREKIMAHAVHVASDEPSPEPKLGALRSWLMVLLLAPFKTEFRQVISVVVFLVLVGLFLRLFLGNWGGAIVIWIIAISRVLLFIVNKRARRSEKPK